jgi:hypothetical protein
MAGFWLGCVGPRAVPLEEYGDVLRILGVFVFMLALSSLTLPVQPVQAAAASPESSTSYPSTEEEKKEEEEEEPDCD